MEVILPSHASIAVTTLVPGHGDVLKGKTFVRQEIALIEAVVAALNEEIGRSSSESQKRFGLPTIQESAHQKTTSAFVVTNPTYKASGLPVNYPDAPACFRKSQSPLTGKSLLAYHRICE